MGTLQNVVDCHLTPHSPFAASSGKRRKIKTVRRLVNQQTAAAEYGQDQQLVERAMAGDSAAQSRLFATHSPRLYRAAFSLLRNKEDAEDAVQDSLMRAFVSINEFRGSSSFSTWLTRIGINSALMIRRKSVTVRRVYLDSETEDRRNFKLEIEDSAPNPEQILVALELRRALRTAIANLRRRVRAVLEVGHLREFSVKETAKVLKISIGAAKARLFQGRIALRKSRALRTVLQSRTETAA